MVSYFHNMIISAKGIHSCDMIGQSFENYGENYAVSQIYFYFVF